MGESLALASERTAAPPGPLSAGLRLPGSGQFETAVGERVETILADLGLEAWRDRFPTQLSTGLRRLVEIGSLVAQEPRVLLLDEPSAGLAEPETQALGRLLLRVRDLTGCAIVIVAHDVPLLLSIADRLVAMDLGRVIADGPPAEVVRHPDVVSSYLGTAARPCHDRPMTEPSLSTGRLCEGRICVVTGGGRGIGREYALMLAEPRAPTWSSTTSAATGPAAAPMSARPSRWSTRSPPPAGRRWPTPTTSPPGTGPRPSSTRRWSVFGGLDVVVNNAGILRDRMLVNMSEEEWDSVIRVHLKGTFATSRHAAAYWRDRSKAGEANDARIINTTSVSGIYGNMGQANYGAAKSGIAGLTIIAARELARYGVTVNAIAPGALTRMTEDLPIPDDVKAALDPRWVAPVCVWLASTLSADVTEQIIEVSGTNFAIAEGWHRGPTGAPLSDPTEVDAAIRKLLADARPHTNFAEMTNQQKKN